MEYKKRAEENAIKRELNCQNRSLQVHMDHGFLNPDGKGTYDLKWVDDMAKLLGQVDGLLPNSWLELKAVQTDLAWDGNKYGVAPYGADPKIFMDADERLFREYSGIKGEYVLQAGRIEAGKNCNANWATHTNMVVLIGGTKHWPAMQNQSNIKLRAVLTFT